MMERFEFQPGASQAGRLIYRAEDHSFDTIEGPTGTYTSFLLNDVQIEVDDAGQFLHVWGYCPRTAWTDAVIQPPAGMTGLVRALRPDLVPGVSIRVGQATWPVVVNSRTGWVCIGDPFSTGDAIACTRDVRIVLRDGELVALWLHPEIVSG
jgi:hypothetical protein